MRRTRLLLAVPALALAVLAVWPLAGLLGHGLAPDALDWLAGPYVQATLRVAAWQAILSTLLAFAVAVPLAWLHHRHAIRAPRLQLALLAAPFVMPVFVVVFGLQLTVPQLLAAGGALGAVVVAHAYYNAGFTARMLAAQLDARPRRLEEAAQVLGASPAQARRRVALPLLAPGVAAIALLVFLFTFSSYGTVLLLGADKVRTLETVLSAQVGLDPDPARAAALGLLQLACNAVLLLGALLLRRRPLPAEPARPRPRAFVATALTWGATLLLLAPLAAVLVGGFRLRGAWSLAPWQALLESPGGFDLGNAVGVSLLYAVGSTALALLLCACIAYGARSLPTWLRRAAEATASLPMAASPILVGLGFLLAFGRSSPLPITGTLWILLLAHTVVVFPFVARALLPAWDARDLRLEQAAATLGAPPRSIAARLHLPLLARPLAAAAGFSMTLSLGDFGASVMLATTDTAGLGLWIARLDGPFDPLLHARAVALAGLLAVLAALALVAVERAALPRRPNA
ncbi:MAG: thiamine transport system permease protein [Thermoplasmata archaeon]|jgi:thiamine transport system permease protein|nr:thiamine transport system permease protein [Thermoplasmata archaeon]